MKQSHTASYYAASANQKFEFPELEGDLMADVCVVGSGITGTTAALELAERGYSVIVLEANRVGWGASGRSGGQAIFGWAAEQSQLEKLVNKDDARKFWQMSLEGLALIKQRIAKYNIECDWRDGMAHVSAKPRQMDELNDWYQSLSQDYGYQGLQLWDRSQLQDQLASQRYHSGLFDPNSGHLHPLNYTLGLVKAAQAAGAQFYENSKVTRIEHGKLVRLSTARGTVSCEHVVLACNAYMEGLSQKTESKIMPVGTYMAASEPLGAAKADALISNNMAVCDMNFVLDYYRRSADHRMLFGGRLSYSGVRPINLEQVMRRRMEWVFPQLEGVKIDHSWGGYIGITMNRAPHFGRIAPNVYFAQGFSGHGIAATGLAGTLMAEAISATSERFDLFDRIPHMPFPGGRMLRTPVMMLAMSYYRIRDLL